MATTKLWEKVLRDDARRAAARREAIARYGFKAVCGYEEGEELRLLPGTKPEHAVTTPTAQ